MRETIRRARANGASEKVQIIYGRYVAKSGVKVIMTKNLKDAAWYDGVNTVYIKADASNVDIYSGLLGHEMFHKMFKSSKVKKLFMEAWNNTPEAKRQEVIDKYMAELKQNKELSAAERINISNEEVAAAYAQELFNSPDVWDFILEGEPSLSDRIIAFFGGVPKRYAFADGMDAAAKRWLNHYKKLFGEVAELNRGESARQNATVVGKLAGEKDSKGKVDVVGRVTETDVNTIRYALMSKDNLSENVDKVLQMDEQEALKNKREGNFVSIMPKTPQIILDNVPDADNLEVIMRFDAFYLATRGSGALEGHYHNYGNIMKKLPQIISDAQAIVRMDNGRLNIFSEVRTEKGQTSTISVELNTVKDIDSKYKKYSF